MSTEKENIYGDLDQFATFNQGVPSKSKETEKKDRIQVPPREATRPTEQPKKNSNDQLLEIAPRFKHEQFESVTAKFPYEDLELARAVVSEIKHSRKRFQKPEGIKRERITENMIYRALLKCFVKHSCDTQVFNWGHVNTEEDLFKEVSKAFKGIQKGGIHVHELD